MVAEWNARITALPASARPPAAQRAAVSALGSCDSPQAFGVGLDAVLLSQFKARLEHPSVQASQRFLTQLMLALWCKGQVAWPMSTQEPFVSAVLSLGNAGWSAGHKAFLARVRSYLDRGIAGDSINFRFFVDMLLSRAGVVELGDVTPLTLRYTPGQTRLPKPRALAFAAVLRDLRETYAPRQVPWTLDSFGFYPAKSGQLRRDDDFLWVLNEDPAMQAWVGLAKQHLADNPTNFKKRRSAMSVFIGHIAQTPSISRSPAAYFDVRHRPDPLFRVEGNPGRQTMTVVHQFLDEVLFKVCTQTDDCERPILRPGFANPLERPTYRGVNKGETHREPMPSASPCLPLGLRKAWGQLWGQPAKHRVV